MIWAVRKPGGIALRGHAGYGPKGADIVCAAASALMLALAERLEETGRLSRLRQQAGEMQVTGRDAERELGLVWCGLRQLERQYPRCVKTIRMEEKRTEEGKDHG